MNIIAILVLTLAINTWGSSMYGLDEFPAMFAAIANATTTVAPVQNCTV